MKGFSIGHNLDYHLQKIMNKELIKNYFKGYSKKGITNAFLKFLRNNLEVEKYLNDILTKNSNWENIKNIVYSICFNEELKHCKNCGKEMKYSKGLNYNYCSVKCTANSKEVKDKIKQTNLERYGCEYSAQNEKVKEKLKQTNLEKYNCTNVFQSEKIKEKIKQTNLERYGVKHPTQNEEVKDKIKQTNLERYRCSCSLQNEEVKDKIKQTNLERYGVEHPTQNEEVKDKIKQTNLERYGVKHLMQNEKVKQIFHDKSFDNLIPKFIQYGITPLFSKEEYEGYDKIYKWKCLICQNEFEQKIYPTNHVKECQYLPHCWKCYPRMSGESKTELELLDFVKQYYPNAHKDNELIKPQELDIIIPELNLAIEYNGDYWHSTECWLEHHDNLDGYYGRHLNKVLETNKKGYRLIHISESEYNNLIPKLKDILEGKENLNFTEDIIKLDRSWYNNTEIPGYELVEELPPEIVNRNKFNVENCGYLVYKRINNIIK